MIKYLCSTIIILMTALTCFSQAIDSSALLFRDDVVNRYSIHFYVNGWRDSLTANKSNGEVNMPARFVWYGPNGDSIVLDSIGVRYKGNSSYAIASDKKPFKFSFDAYRKKQRFFSLEKLNFSNCVQDPSMMREKIAYDVLGKYLPSPRASFAILTIGDMLVDALYTQVEQVDELFLKRHFSNDKCNLYKAGDQGATLAYKSANQNDYTVDYELKTNEKENNWSGFITMLEKLNNTPDADFVSIVGKCLDLDNCIRYLAFNMANGNFDSYTGSSRNFYVYDNKGKYTIIPWDVNLSFGAYAYTWKNDIAGVDAFNPSNLDQRPLVKRILAIDTLKRVYADYMKKMINGPLNADSVAILAHKYKTVVDSSVSKDVKKFYTYDQFVTNIDEDVVIQAGMQKTILLGLKSFTSERNAEVLSQIEAVLPVVDEISYRSSAAFSFIGKSSGKCFNIQYAVKTAAEQVTVKIFNAKGEVVRNLNEGIRNKGIYSTSLNMHSLPCGYYAIMLKAGRMTASQGVLLVDNR